uniref:RRM domain-containing protein n=1 Tax=Meloidogyne incognita TaxID=6306 RepID=A0A914KP78_MELIC
MNGTATEAADGTATSNGETSDELQKFSQKDAACYLRCRGLPYSASESDVRKFFEDWNVVEVSFTSSIDGKPTGECYVQFGTRQDASDAQSKDRQTIGSRYIEVFQVSDIEMEQLMKRLLMKRTMATKGFVRVRGLPYTCTKDQVQQFFQGLTVEEVVFGKEPGLEGRPTGEGFVKFGASEEAERALQLNGQHMGTRYLEIFKSDGAAFEAFKLRSQNNIVPLKALAQSTPDWGPGYGGGYGYGGGGYGYGPGPGDHYGSGYSFGSGYEQRGGGGRPYGRGYNDAPSNRYSPYPNYGGGYGYGGGGGGGRHGGRGNRGGGDYRGGYDDGYGGGGYGGGAGYGGYQDSIVGPTKVYMRGIPFRITAAELERFFAPLVLVDIQIGAMPDGRSSGDGIVEFQTPADARQALSKDRESIGSRYIELFPTVNAKIPSHVNYNSIGGKGGALPRAGGAAAGGGSELSAPSQQYGQYGQYGNDYYGYGGAGYGGAAGAGYGASAAAGYGGGAAQDVKPVDYNWPTAQY